MKLTNNYRLAAATLLALALTACGGGGGGGGSDGAAKASAGNSSTAGATGSSSGSQSYEKTNGVIKIRLNDVGPLITNMWINGMLVVPHDNLGADFQMATRSSLGDAYNPTQAGDCAGNRSILSGVLPNWTTAQSSVPESNGILLGIDPLNYNEPTFGDCKAGTGTTLPYSMAFGVSMGDDVHMPKEVMIVEMSVKKDQATAPDLIKEASELPVLFVDTSKLYYAYYAEASAQGGGLAFVPFNINNSNDVRQWSYLANHYQSGKALMLCDRADVLQNAKVGTCLALYSHEQTNMYASHRQGAIYDLALISVLGDNPSDSTISDVNWHTARRLVLVGNAGDVAAGAAWAEQNLNPEHWARW